MEITLNNRKETFDDGITITDILRIKKYSFKLIITMINGKMIKKDDRNEVVINDGDKVSIIHMISGG